MVLIMYNFVIGSGTELGAGGVFQKYVLLGAGKTPINTFHLIKWQWRFILHDGYAKLLVIAGTASTIVAWFYHNPSIQVEIVFYFLFWLLPILKQS